MPRLVVGGLCGLALAGLTAAAVQPSSASAADGIFLAAGTTGGLSAPRLPSVPYVPRVGLITGKTVWFGTGGLQRARDYDGEGGGALELGLGVRHSVQEAGKKKAGTFLLGQLQTTLFKYTDETLPDVFEHDKLRTVLLGGGVEAQLAPTLTLSGELAYKQQWVARQGTTQSVGSVGSLATGLFLNWRL